MGCVKLNILDQQHKTNITYTNKELTFNFSLKNVCRYLVYGEILSNKRSTGSNYNTPYKFSAKEKDQETGFNYHGARYYIDYMYVWMSPDPLSDEYPSTSPYMYCSGNPVMRVDPNGMNDDEWIYNMKSNTLIWMGNESGSKMQIVDFAKPHESGAMTWEGTAVHDGPITDFFSKSSDKKINWSGIADGIASAVGGGAIAYTGAGIGVTSGGILSPLAALMVFEGGHQFASGIAQITSSFNGVESDKLPFTTIAGSISQSRNVDNWVALGTGVASSGASLLKPKNLTAIDMGGMLSTSYTAGKILMPNKGYDFKIPQGAKIITKYNFK
ncbi:MAG: hypothetical protein GX259_10680, partial [Bacteroidales bacterium]|nr:hypothetical protein [Bacteroidales bacterium]